MASASVSGVAVAMTATGAYLVWAGVNNVSLYAGLRQLLRGQVPATRAAVATPVVFRTAEPAAAGVTNVAAGGAGAAGGALGARIVAAARKHMGAPYVWGAAGPKTFDCSGLVSYVLAHDLGLPVKRMYTQQFLVWSGARTVSWADQAAGDLACWSGHIGICLGDGRMIHAPRPGLSVMIDKIWRVPTPSIRRVTATRSA